MELYRLRDDAGRLLYVGISYSAIVRQAQHKAQQPWWGQVARIEVQRLGNITRTEAEAIERDAIHDEKPAHNVTHNGKPKGAQAIRATEAVNNEKPDAQILASKEGQALMSAVSALFNKHEGLTHPQARRLLAWAHRYAAIAEMCHDPRCDTDRLMWPVATVEERNGQVKAAYVCGACGTWDRAHWSSTMLNDGRCS